MESSAAARFTEGDVNSLISSASSQADVTFGVLQRRLTKNFLLEKLNYFERKLITDCLMERRKYTAKEIRNAENASFDAHYSSTHHTCLIISSYTTDYSIGRLCTHINKRYAEKHNYPISVEVLEYDAMLRAIEPRKHCTWYKVLMINRYLSDIDELLRRGIRYILWIDADAVIVDDEIALEDFIRRAGKADLIVSEDMTKCSLINAGVMLIRVGEWSRALWSSIWSSPASSKYHDVCFYEQSALQSSLRLAKEGMELIKPFHTYQGGPDIKQTPHLFIYPHYEFNTNWDIRFERYKEKVIDKCPEEGIPLLQLGSEETESGREAAEAKFAKFIFHAAGLSNKLSSLLRVLAKRNICLPEELVSELTSEKFLLFRSSGGRPPRPEHIEARARFFSLQEKGSALGDTL